MPALNGKTYEMQYLTDEETAVINAMRRGGKVEVNFFNSTDEVAEAHGKELESIVDKIDIRDLRTGTTGEDFTSYEIHIGNHKVFHFVDK